MSTSAIVDATSVSISARRSAPNSSNAPSTGARTITTSPSRLSSPAELTSRAIVVNSGSLSRTERSSSSLLTGNDSVVVVSLTIEPKVAVGCGTSVVEGIEAVPAPPTVGARNTRHDRSTTTERTPSTALRPRRSCAGYSTGEAQKMVPS